MCLPSLPSVFFMTLPVDGVWALTRVRLRGPRARSRLKGKCQLLNAEPGKRWQAINTRHLQKMTKECGGNAADKGCRQT